MLSYIFIVGIVLVVFNCQKAEKLKSNIDVSQNSKGDSFYGLSIYYPKDGDGKIMYIGESPMNEATVQVFEDGVI
jgi:hypothetical protein